MRYTVILALLMLYDFVDLFPAMGAAARYKTIYTVESSGPKTLAGIKAQAILVLPDTASNGTVPYNTVSGEAYSITTIADSSRTSGSDGRVAIRLALTADIYPPGCRWQLLYQFRSQTRRIVYVTMLDTAQECLSKVLGQAATCP